MMGNQKVYGAIPYNNRDERRELYKQLKAEFGDRITIKNENGLLVYSAVDLAS